MCVRPHTADKSLENRNENDYKCIKASMEVDEAAQYTADIVER